MNPIRDTAAVSEVPAVTPAADHEHGACANCHAALQGHYCHQCGQSAHNPLKNFGHAVEEVFESFWHLDGRIFRTLRDLLVPGRVAINFIKGHRVGYVQPLRLFVILTLFTFFVGKLTLHIDDIQVSGGDNAIFATAQTVHEVETQRAAKAAELERDMGSSPGVGPAFAVAMAAMNAAAAERTAELEAQAPTPAGSADTAMTPATDTAAPATAQKSTFFNYRINGKPWHPETNPVVLPGWPRFVNKWLNRRLENGNANVERMGSEIDLYMQAVLTALPGALFFLMPVFALVLRVAYLGRGTGYLEHLVVALYSHAWLMLVLLTTFLTIGIIGAINRPLVSAIGGFISVALWLAIPVYLLWMQQRVYGGRWWVTLARYTFVGSIYFCLVVFVVMYATLAGVSA